MKKILVLVFLLSAFVVANAQKIGTQIGDIAPEISLPNADGDTIKLSSMRGKVVLIDFWASWCGPCRKENPIVVDAYKNYKDKFFTVGEGFTVFGVSLDKSKENWVAAISKDGLVWSNVSDLKYWDCVSGREYGVKSIPCNFLIDKDGVILAKNLRGEMLKNALESYIQKNPIESFDKKLTELQIELNGIKEMKQLENSNDDIEKLESYITKLRAKTDSLKKKYEK